MEDSFANAITQLTPWLIIGLKIIIGYWLIIAVMAGIVLLSAVIIAVTTLFSK